MRLLQPINALRDALVDPARRERSVLAALAIYVVLWTIYGTIAKSSQGLHPDMTELIAWSRDLSFGYLKHPPLAAWLVWLWFSVLPVAEWSYYLLAMLMPTLALWIVWRLSADYLDAEKRVVGLALLMLVPFFNFHALKFNVNTVLIPAWAATTLWFLRSYKTRSRVYAALAGAGAAACMLGKYWSVFLLAGLAVAALIDRRRADYFRSAAPWLAVVAGLAVLAPHLLWLYQHDFAPFGYAMGIHGEKPFAACRMGRARLSRRLGRLCGDPGDHRARRRAAKPRDHRRYDLAGRPRTPAGGRGVLGSLAAAGRRRAGEPHRTHLAVVDAGLDAAAGAAAVAAGSDDGRRRYAPRSRRAVAVPLVMLIASPAIAIIAQRGGPAPASAQARLLAGQVERAWHDATAQPLRYVGGEADLAYGVITYASERPRALPDLPQPSDAELAQSGMVLVCFAEDANCRRAAATRAPGGRIIESEIVRNFLGFAGRAQRYTIVMVPPRP